MIVLWIKTWFLQNMVICVTKCHSLQNTLRTTIPVLQRCLKDNHFQIVLIYI